MRWIDTIAFNAFNFGYYALLVFSTGVAITFMRTCCHIQISIEGYISSPIIWTFFSTGQTNGESGLIDQ